MKKIYIWYSGATDVTGKNLVEKLTEKLNSDMFEISGGILMPENADIVICYGTKTREDTVFDSNVKVLNHPNTIRINRNKLAALDKMLYGEVNVPYFTELPEGIDDSEIIYPVIVRTKYHQGGRGLAMCTSPEQVSDLITNYDNVGFGYIQELIPFKQEYRIHVFNGKIIRAAIKNVQTNPIDSWKAIYKEKAEIAAERNGVELNIDTVNILLKSIVKDLTFPNLLVKSNKNGWRFSRIAVGDVNTDIIAIAKKAVVAIGLDFGAVDCAIDYDERAWVIEVNTGPGLQGGTLTSYVETLEEYIDPSTGTNVVSRPNTGMRAELNDLMAMTATMTAKISELSQQINME